MFHITEPDVQEQLMQFLGDVAIRARKLADFIDLLDSSDPSARSVLSGKLRTASRACSTVRDKELTMPLYEPEDPYEIG